MKYELKKTPENRIQRPVETLLKALESCVERVERFM